MNNSSQIGRLVALGGTVTTADLADRNQRPPNNENENRITDRSRAFGRVANEWQRWAIGQPVALDVSAIFKLTAKKEIGR